jgi:hypothetical protein
MTKVGILVHCRHLETDGWEELVFGDPTNDKLGDQSTLLRVLLTLEPTEDVACIVFGRGPSVKDGLNEGEYPKKFLLDNLDRMKEFPRLRPLLDNLSPNEYQKLRTLLEQIIVTDEIKNTVAEVEAASNIFTEHGVTKVVQIAAASHVSRCIKEQAVARSHGKINKAQQWFTVATEMTYHNTLPEDVCIIEPLHRRDQPMTYVRPGMSEVMKPYPFLPDYDKKRLITLVKNFMDARK